MDRQAKGQSEIPGHVVHAEGEVSSIYCGKIKGETNWRTQGRYFGSSILPFW